MVVGAGPLATRSCEPRQTRKGAAAAADVGAGVWLALTAAILLFSSQESLINQGFLNQKSYNSHL